MSVGNPSSNIRDHLLAQQTLYTYTSVNLYIACFAQLVQYLHTHTEVTNKQSHKKSVPHRRPLVYHIIPYPLRNPYRSNFPFPIPLSISRIKFHPSDPHPVPVHTSINSSRLPNHGTTHPPLSAHTQHPNTSKHPPISSTTSQPATKDQKVRQEGIEPPARRWQRRILPLNH